MYTYVSENKQQRAIRFREEFKGIQTIDSLLLTILDLEKRLKIFRQYANEIS